MGIQDRKVRERDSFRKLIVATAHELLLTQGLKGLTMRALANTIEYSQSKIYEFFKNKDQLCEVIFEELCEKMLNEMMTVPKDLPPGQYFTELNMKVIEFPTISPIQKSFLTSFLMVQNGSKPLPFFLRWNGFQKRQSKISTALL